MNLSRNDKVIAIVGVIILIIAAISIAYIISTQEDEELEPEPEEETFYVTWTNASGEMTIDGLAQKTYNEPFTVMAPTGSVITNVDVKLTWSDDNTIGGRIIQALKRGEDTLTAEITSPDGESIKKSSTGSGSPTFSFSLNGIPSDDVIDADDILDAEDMVMNTYVGQDTASFDVSVRVEIGEPYRRPIKRFMDKGDNFKLTVTYDYYYYIVESESNENDDYEEDDENGDEESYLGAYYQNLCSGRGWI